MTSNKSMPSVILHAECFMAFCTVAVAASKRVMFRFEKDMSTTVD